MMYSTTPIGMARIPAFLTVPMDGITGVAIHLPVSSQMHLKWRMDRGLTGTIQHILPILMRIGIQGSTRQSFMKAQHGGNGQRTSSMSIQRVGSRWECSEKMES